MARRVENPAYSIEIWPKYGDSRQPNPPKQRRMVPGSMPKTYLAMAVLLHSHATLLTKLYFLCGFGSLTGSSVLTPLARAPVEGFAFDCRHRHFGIFVAWHGDCALPRCKTCHYIHYMLSQDLQPSPAIFVPSFGVGSSVHERPALNLR